jgi:integrase
MSRIPLTCYIAGAFIALQYLVCLREVERLMDCARKHGR